MRLYLFVLTLQATVFRCLSKEIPDDEYMREMDKDFRMCDSLNPAVTENRPTVGHSIPIPSGHDIICFRLRNGTWIPMLLNNSIFVSTHDRHSLNLPNTAKIPSRNGNKNEDVEIDLLNLDRNEPKTHKIGKWLEPTVLSKADEETTQEKVNTNADSETSQSKYQQTKNLGAHDYSGGIMGEMMFGLLKNKLIKGFSTENNSGVSKWKTTVPSRFTGQSFSRTGSPSRASVHTKQTLFRSDMTSPLSLGTVKRQQQTRLHNPKVPRSMHALILDKGSDERVHHIEKRRAGFLVPNRHIGLYWNWHNLYSPVYHRRTLDSLASNIIGKRARPYHRFRYYLKK